jgi:ATP-dependent DNA ligase
MLPSLALEPPKGDQWIHEIKFDGYRTVLVVGDSEARAFTRNRLDWSDRYRPVVEAAGKLRCRSAVIDGEVVALDWRRQIRLRGDENRRRAPRPRTRLCCVRPDVSRR